MIYKKDRKATALEAVAASDQKTHHMSVYLMNTTIIAAGVLASKIIMENVTVFTH